SYGGWSSDVCSSDLFERSSSIVRQRWRDFETHVAVALLGGCVHLLHDVGRILDVTDGDLFINSLGVEVRGVQPGELVGIIVASRDSLLEDCRIGGDAGETI